MTTDVQLPVMRRFQPGDEVTPTRSLGEHLADEGFAPSTCATAGERLIIREVRLVGPWDYAVSHHDRSDGITFCCSDNELAPYNAQAHRPATGAEK